MSDEPFEILMVEDNLADVRLAQRAFKNSNARTVLRVVRDGVEAMAFLRREGAYADAGRPGLIFLDLNLPRKDGREVLAEIKADAELRRIPVVVLTTSHAERDIVTSYDLNANCYIVKPADVDRFFDVMSSTERFWLETATKSPR